MNPYLLTQMKALLLLSGYGTLPRAFNLLLFLAVMFFILRKPITEALKTRRESIKEELKRARAEKEAAEAKLRTVEERLARLDQEIDEIKAEAEKEAQAEYGRLVRQAEMEAEQLKAAAQREIESAMKIARMQLREFVAEKSVELASQMLAKDIRPKDDERLLEEFTKELEEVRK